MALPSPTPAQPQLVAPPSPRDDVRLDLRGYTAVLLKWRWTIVVTFAAVMAFTSIWLVRQPKIYKASASLIIDPRPPQVLQGVSEVVEIGAGSYWQTQQFYETQYDFIRRRVVSQRVVERLALDQDLDFLGLSGVEDPALVEEYRAASDPVAILQSMINVEPVKESRTVEVAIFDTNPERAALLATAVAEAYVDENLGKRVTGTSTVLDWLDERLKTLKPRLEASEMALFEFRKANDMLSASLEDRQNMVSQKLEALGESLADLRTRRIELEAKVKRIEELRKEGGEAALASVPDVTRSETLKLLKVSWMAATQEHAALEKRYLDQHPKLIEAARSKEAAQATLQSEISRIIAGITNEYETVREAERRTEKEIEQVKTEAFELNKKEIEYNRLAREKQNNERLYELVLARSKEAGLTVDQRTNNVRLVDAALVPRRPVKPRVTVTMMLGAAAGLFLGIALAFVREQLDNTVKLKREIEEDLDLPFLGIIPKIDEEEARESEGPPELHVYSSPRSHVAEACRAIRTNLLFMSPERPLKRLLVTSAGPKEGKTTTVVDLGIVMAQSGGTVVLVDTDMRRPRLHRVFGAGSEKGLSSLLVGDGGIDDVIVETSIPDLFLLPCGPIPPNPAELLHTKRFESILEKLGRKFDRVVLDSPPLGAVADGKVLSVLVDGTVLVAKSHQTTKDMLRQAAESLIDVNGRILGVVLNHVDLARREYGGYYEYYRHYGAYYGSDRAEPDAK